MKKLQKICFIIAMENEAELLMRHYDLQFMPQNFDAFLPMKAYKNNYRNIEISLLVNGKDTKHNIDNIGTQAAVLTSYLAIKYFNPDLIINAGTAGGFKDKGLHIADVVIAQNKAYFHDRRIPIPQFKEYGLGAFPLEDRSKMIESLGLKSGVLSTGNSFDFNDQDLAIMKSLDISLKDMEAASIAWLADLANIPLLIVKGVTDYVLSSKSSEEEFLANFEQTVDNLSNACIEIIDYYIKPN